VSRPRPHDPWANLRKSTRPSKAQSVRAWEGLVQRLEAEAADPVLPEPPVLEDEVSRAVVVPIRRIAVFSVGVAAAVAILVVAIGRWTSGVPALREDASPNLAMDSSAEQAPSRALEAPVSARAPAAETSGSSDSSATTLPLPERSPAVERGPRTSDARIEKPADTASGSTFDAELALVRSARAALDASEPAQALSLLAEHARRFPSGSLGHERRATEIAALCALGRLQEAEHSARSFTAAFPHSGVARALAERACPP